MAACHNFCITNLKSWHSKLIRMAQKTRRVFGKILLDISFPRASRSLLFRLFHHGVLYSIMSVACPIHFILQDTTKISNVCFSVRYTYIQQRCSLKHFYPAAEWMLQFGAQLRDAVRNASHTKLHVPTFSHFLRSQKWVPGYTYILLQYALAIQVHELLTRWLTQAPNLFFRGLRLRI
jgi:hypothetical protein